MKKSYLYGAAALGLLFTGCSSDDIIDKGGSEWNGDRDKDFYVSLRISGDVPGAGTRAAEDNGTPDATDFSDGTGNESTVSSVYFVFYDNKGDVVGDVTSVELDDSKWTSTTTEVGVEKFYKSVVKVSVKSGETEPTQVICYINPVNNGNLNVRLDQIQTLKLETPVKGSGSTQRFPMSNSVYYTSSDDQAQAPRIAVPLEKNVNIFSSESEAEQALAANNCAQIYVERYATKLKFKVEPNAQTPFVTGQRVWNTENGTEIEKRNKITLEFIPQWWAVNAESKETYVIKSFRKESPDGNLLAENYTYTALNERINNGLEGTNAWVWNAPLYNRSYWGMSPAYFTKDYPEVSSDLDMINHKEPQKYISYNELKDKKKGFNHSNDTAQYFKETTVGHRALNSKNPAAAVASVIYVGKYQMKLKVGDNIEQILPDSISFYTYLSGPVPGATQDTDDQPYVYFRNAVGSVNSAVTGGESMLKRFLVQCNILYKKDGNNYVAYELGNGSGFNDLINVLDVSELSPAEKQAFDGNDTTTLKLQHNARTLRFKRVPTNTENIYVLTYNGYRRVVENPSNTDEEISLIQANIALARNVGYALAYQNGHAYFSIPVKHFGWYRAGNANKGKNDIDWNEVHVGDFGMVRNHSYEVNVEKVVGLGLGIGGDDVELVPPSYTQDYYMSYQVHILKWAVVPKQGVNL